ncbi:hypothetical protein RB201_04160 [Streptomyces sp. S1A(2023)]
MADRSALVPRVQPDARAAWMERSGLAYWLGYVVHEPRDFVYCVPRRAVCRLFRRHNVTCRGRRDHPHH